MQSIMGRTHIKKCATSMHPTQPPPGQSLVPSDPGMYVMLCYVILCLLCYAMVGCCVVPCPKNFSAQSDPVSFCASDNKRLVTCKHWRQRLLGAGEVIADAGRRSEEHTS